MPGIHVTTLHGTGARRVGFSAERDRSGRDIVARQSNNICVLLTQTIVNIGPIVGAAHPQKVREFVGLYTGPEKGQRHTTRECVAAAVLGAVHGFGG